MTKSIAETRFEKARQRLSDALLQLEEVIKDKLHESSQIQARIGGYNDSGAMDQQVRIIEQSVTIQNLISEMNNLQKTLVEIEKETDFTRERNTFLTKKMSEIYDQNHVLINAIESDLTRLEEVINK